jgi:hypothetical protein
VSPTVPSSPVSPAATQPTAQTPAPPPASQAAERAAAAAVRDATGESDTNPRGVPVDVREDDERPMTRRERRGRE